jgi:hemoglobin
VPDLPDIENRDDIERLVRAFYGKAMTDEIIGYIFTDVAKLDLEEHVPKFVSFWETNLLGEQTYSGGAFHVHANIHHKSPLRKGHFERWLVLWTRTVDELFDGPHAALAKVHALRIGNAFFARLENQSGAETTDQISALLPITQHGNRSN